MFNCCKPLLAPERRKEVAVASPEASPFAPSFDAEMMRSKSESRILQPAPSGAGGGSGGDRRSSTNSARSLFEASAYRVASHVDGGPSGTPDADDGGLPQRFLDAYVAALRDANPRWATESADVSDMFTSNAKLITQDKQTMVGKSNVLRRLDQGESASSAAGGCAPGPDPSILCPRRRGDADKNGGQGRRSAGVGAQGPHPDGGGGARHAVHGAAGQDDEAVLPAGFSHRGRQDRAAAELQTIAYRGKRADRSTRGSKMKAVSQRGGAGVSARRYDAAGLLP